MKKIVILLLIKDKDGNKHYCLVKNLSRLLSKEVSKKKCKRHFCYYCFNSFNTETSLRNHMEYCVMTVFPEKGKNDILKFINHGRMYKMQFVIYSDVESFTKKKKKIITPNTILIIVTLISIKNTNHQDLTITWCVLMKTYTNERKYITQRNPMMMTLLKYL